MHHMHARACGCEEKASEPLELQLQEVVSHRVNAGDRTLVSARAVNALNRRPSPPLFSLFATELESCSVAPAGFASCCPASVS